MNRGFRCPECGAANRLFDAMNGSVLASTRELRLEDALQRIVDVVKQLVGARFAAVGVTGEGDRFATWVTAGDVGGPVAPPAIDGALAFVLRSRTSWVTCDVASEAAGGLPDGLPAISSVLAVPIVADDEVLGAFYLGNEDRWGFSPDDSRKVELVAPHAAVAIANARLRERSRELTVLQERTRLARELHDSVTQALFSMRLTADTALALAEGDPAAARSHVERLRGLAGTALSEMRALLAELRPPEVEARGIVESLRNHVDVLRQVHGVDIRFDAVLRDRLQPRVEAELFRLAQEALANAVCHSGAASIEVGLEARDAGVRLTVHDDGRGFDVTAVAGRGRFGLTSMRERAQALSAELTIRSTPGKGTSVSVEVPR